MFNLFDTVELRVEVALNNGRRVPAGMVGAIVEVWGEGAAYEVELFAPQANAEGFKDTIAVATLAPEQLALVVPAREALRS